MTSDDNWREQATLNKAVAESIAEITALLRGVTEVLNGIQERLDRLENGQAERPPQ